MAELTDARTFGELIDSIYNTVEQPDVWTVVIDQINLVSGSSKTALYATFPDTKTPALMATNAEGAYAWSHYSPYYAQINPLMERAEHLLATDTTWFGCQVISDQELEKTEFYNDYYSRYGMHHAVGLRIPLSDTSAANLSCQRSKAEGPFPDSVDSVFQALRPHIKRALTLSYKLGLADATAAGAIEGLSRYQISVIGLNREQRVIFTNTPCEEVFKQGSIGLRNGLLVLRNTKEQEKLQKLILSVLNPKPGDPAASGGTIAIGNPSEPVYLTVTPAPGTSRFVTLSLAVLVFINNSQRMSSVSKQIGPLFRLTPTELRVAEIIGRGIDAKVAADMLHMTYDSIRFHMKRIYVKTKTTKQSELIRLLITLPRV